MHARKSLRGIYKCECPGGYPSSSKTCSLSSSSSLPPSLTLFYYSALLLVLLNMKTAVFLLTISCINAHSTNLVLFPTSHLFKLPLLHCNDYVLLSGTTITLREQCHSFFVREIKVDDPCHGCKLKLSFWEYSTIRRCHTMRKTFYLTMLLETCVSVVFHVDTTVERMKADFNYLV